MAIGGPLVSGLETEAIQILDLFHPHSGVNSAPEITASPSKKLGESGSSGCGIKGR
jgi:hypothetical protein